MNVSRRILLRAATAATAVSALPARSQGAGDDGPLRVIVGLPPGGAADVSARSIAHAHEKLTHRPVIVENRPGGQFQISMQALASAPADGRTLLYLYNGYASVQVVQKLFDLDKQLAPVTQVGSTAIVLLVRGDSAHRTMNELVDYGRRNPGKLTYGTLGPGSVEHLKVEQINRAAKVRAVAVPYKGGPDMVKAVMGGEIDFCLGAGIFAKQFGPTGKLKELAVLEAARWADLPDVPTLAEVGIAVAPMSYWGGYAVRAGTPPDIVARLHRELGEAASAPSVVASFAAAGTRLMLSKSPDAFRQLLASDVAWMTEAAKDLNLAS